MKPVKNIYIIIGFMLFALFFGAGNLIYPAFLGIYSGSNLVLAILGFCLTGVTLPLLGVVAVAYSGASDIEDFCTSSFSPLCFAIFNRTLSINRAILCHSKNGCYFIFNRY